MKPEKTFQKVQFIGGAVFILALILKSFATPFMGPLLVVSSTILVMLLMTLMIYFLIAKWKISRGVAFLLFFINFCSSYLIMGILFGVMFWPGSQNMIVVAIYIYFWLVIVPGAIYYLMKGRKRDDFWPLLSFDLLKSILLIVFAAFLYALPMDKKIDMFAADPVKMRETLRKQEEENRMFLEKKNQE
jgi:hypothetical protein